MRTFNNDQEQLEFLKAWWQSYGKVILLGLCIGVLLMFSWRYYQTQRVHHSAQASTLYEQILKSFQAKDYGSLRAQVVVLKKDYQDTPYAMLAALIQARIDAENSQLPEAKTQLQWVLDHAKDKALRQVSRIRLAKILLQEKAYDPALALLAKNDYPAFDIYTNEIKGDIYLAKGDIPNARATYQAILKQGDPALLGNIVAMKLANLNEK